MLIVSVQFYKEIKSEVLNESKRIINYLQYVVYPCPQLPFPEDLEGGGTERDLILIFHSLLQVSIPLFFHHIHFPPSRSAILSMYMDTVVVVIILLLYSHAESFNWISSVKPKGAGSLFPSSYAVEWATFWHLWSITMISFDDSSLQKESERGIDLA